MTKLTRFRVHALITPPGNGALIRPDPFKTQYDVSVFTPEAAATAARNHFAALYPGASIIIGKIKVLGEDKPLNARRGK